MIYPIIAYGDSVLKKPARDLKKGEVELSKLVEDMYETMYEAHGVGLAAPQIGLGYRLFIVDGEPLDENLKDFKKVFVNPVILEQEGTEWPFEEGCLSIPGIRSEVLRAPKLKIKYLDENWNEFTEEFDGLRARIIQHEYDHIQGVLFIDHLSAIKKRLIKAKLSNISKGKVDVDYKMKFPLKK